MNEIDNSSVIPIETNDSNSSVIPIETNDSNSSIGLLFEKDMTFVISENVPRNSIIPIALILNIFDISRIISSKYRNELKSIDRIFDLDDIVSDYEDEYPEDGIFSILIKLYLKLKGKEEDKYFLLYKKLPWIHIEEYGNNEMNIIYNGFIKHTGCCNMGIQTEYLPFETQMIYTTNSFETAYRKLLSDANVTKDDPIFIITKAIGRLLLDTIDNLLS